MVNSFWELYQLFTKPTTWWIFKLLCFHPSLALLFHLDLFLNHYSQLFSSTLTHCQLTQSFWPRPPPSKKANVTRNNKVDTFSAILAAKWFQNNVTNTCPNFGSLHGWFVCIYLIIYLVYFFYSSGPLLRLCTKTVKQVPKFRLVVALCYSLPRIIVSTRKLCQESPCHPDRKVAKWTKVTGHFWPRVT